MIRFIELKVAGFGAFEKESTVKLNDRGRVLITGKNNDTASAESNGAGKTTIFKALTWALYGKTVDGLTTDVVHRRAKAAEVSLTFEDDGATYQITRRRTPKTGKLTLVRTLPTVEDMTQSKAAATQEGIEALVGMDFATFRCTALFGQGDHSRFASRDLGDAARKEILGRVLDLRKYETARATATKLRGELEEAARMIHRKIDGVDRQVSEQERIRVKAEGGLEATLDPVDLRAKADEYKDGIAEATLAAGESDATAVDIGHTIAELDDDRVEILALLDRANSLHSAALETSARTRRDYEVLKGMADATHCPTCAQPMPDAHEVDPDELAGAKGAWDKAAKRVKALDKSKRDANAEDRELQLELREATAVKAAAERMAQNSRDEVTRYEREYEEAMADADRVGSVRKVYEDEIKEAERVMTSLIEERVDFMTEAHTVEKERSVADWWARLGFGSKGVPAYAIEQALPVINARANRHLITLSDGDLKVRWSALATGSTGTVKEELTQGVVIEGITDASPSGGQQKKIELATELALAEMRHGTSAHLDLLLLDEALDGLDSEGQRRVCAWLEGLGARSIFVVSHDAAIAEDFDTVVLVEKTGGAAVIKEAS